MNTNSNGYTIGYAAVMVVIVAFLLAFVSSVLKPTQDKNVELDKKKQILAALNQRGLEKNSIEATYTALVKSDLIINEDGSVKAEEGGFKATNSELVVYVCEVEGAKKYVFPVTGKGLWGGLWGYIALNDDFQTVFGVYMSHESETAGLGSVIAEEKFQKKFDGKSVFAEGDAEKVALTVVKAGKVANDAIEVDGITGATLTCNGVAAMVNGGLQNYVNFFNVNKVSNE